MATYIQGFEDAIELALAEAEKSKNQTETKHRLRRILGLLKEQKFERIRTLYLIGPFSETEQGS